MQLATIPDSHVELVDGRYTAILTTLMPDGQPQSTPVWCNRDGDYVLINTMTRFRKAKNMRENPKVTLLIFDPQNPLHNVEIRGVVTKMSEDGAEEHLDELTSFYSDKPGMHFFGDVVPVTYRETHIPVRVTIAPIRVRVEGLSNEHT